MAFIGNTNITQAFTPAIDTFSGNGSTVAFTLSRPVASVAQVQVVIANVPQDPNSAYTVSSNTITFTSAPLSGTNNIYVYYTSPITQVITPGQGTVTSDSFGTITNFTTTGNTILGDATTDTLTVGVTGIVKDASGNVGIGTASPTQLLTLSNGATPRLSLKDTRATVEMQVLADNVAGYSGTVTNFPYIFVTNNSERMRIDTSGNVGIGTSSPSYKLDVTGSIRTSSVMYVNGGDGSIQRSGGNAWVIVSSNTGYGTAGAHLKLDGGGGVWIYNNTTATFYVASTGIYGTTTASAANVFVDSANQLYRSTSSIKYKTDVQDATHGLADALKLRAVTYKGKNDGGTVFGGLIAEEVHEAGLTEFVQYAEDGSPDALAYGNMVSLAFKAIQEQQALIQSLTARITALENR
jgi:hypothetical protein